jgi:hypothetical protein
MFAPSGILWLALAIFHAVSAVACIEVNGGAAELSWTLRDFEGKPIKRDNEDGHPCELTNIEWIRLHWQAVGDGGTGIGPSGDHSFRCQANRGITEFTIPAGRQMLWIEPVCGDDIDAARYEVPPPIVRNVEQGTVLTLDALLIVADRDCTCPTSPSSCPTEVQ